MSTYGYVLSPAIGAEIGALLLSENGRKIIKYKLFSTGFHILYLYSKRVFLEC